MSIQQRLAIAYITLGVLTGSSTAYAESVEDYLQERWFEVEVFVFERLPVLDATTNEDLTSFRARAWPHNLMLMSESQRNEKVQTSEALSSSRYVGNSPEAWCPDVGDPVQLRLPRRTSFADSRGDLGDDRSTNISRLPTALDGVRTEIAAFESSLFRRAYRPIRQLALADASKTINRRRHLRPLIHQRWLQPVPARDEPQALYISSEVTQRAPATRHGMAKVEGFIELTVGRYLHFAPTLWYHADNVGAKVQPFPAVVDINNTGANRRLDDIGYMTLRESRRMRSAELHYIDHPKLGIIVRIDPIAIPERLKSNLAEALSADTAE